MHKQHNRVELYSIGLATAKMSANIQTMKETTEILFNSSVPREVYVNTVNLKDFYDYLTIDEFSLRYFDKRFLASRLSSTYSREKQNALYQLLSETVVQQNAVTDLWETLIGRTFLQMVNGPTVMKKILQIDGSSIAELHIIARTALDLYTNSAHSNRVQKVYDGAFEHAFSYMLDK